MKKLFVAALALASLVAAPAAHAEEPSADAALKVRVLKRAHVPTAPVSRPAVVATEGNGCVIRTLEGDASRQVVRTCK